MARNSGTFKREYSDEEVHAALELGAAVGRNAAVRQLGISKSTFQAWTERHPQLWSDLQSGDRQAQKRRIAGNLEDLADQYTSMEFEALERAEKLIKTADAKELAGLIKAMGASRGLATVGARATRGEDAQVIEHNINFGALEAAANAILERAKPPALVVENEAESD